MKAIQINQYGGTENLKLNDKVPDPVIKNGQVLVEVFASSINPFDTFVLAGFTKDRMPLNFPVILGGDFSGKVKQVSPDVNDFKAGDDVYGQAIVFNGGSGAFAQELASNTKNMSLKPKSISFIEAASLPLVGASAIQAVEDTIKLKPGQKILIHGAAGGIGSIAVQIAKSLGAYVAATSSGEDINLVKSLGADEVIDYKTEKFEDKLKDFDAVYDTIGGDVTKRSFKVLKKGGIIASMKGQPDQQMAQEYGVTGVAVNTVTTKERLEKLTQLVDSGKVKPQVDKIFSLEDIQEAFNYKSKSHPKGKVVIKIKD